jgi:ABC-type sugar transport system substrate-binding protein
MHKRSVVARRHRRALASCVLLLAALVLLAACGSSDDNDTSGGGSGDNASKQLVMFVPTSTNTYVAEWIKGAKAEAAKQGFEVKLLENNFDQTEQDTQVQQQLASGNDPAGYIWWPSDNRAGVASLRRLAATGVPVVQTNQTPLKESEEFVTAYAGVDDKLNGRVAGANVMKARDALKASGVELSSPEGNLLIIAFPAGYQATIDRLAGLKEGMAEAPLKTVREEFADFTPDAGYKAMSQLYPALEEEGIDVVLVGDDGQASGVIKALKEAGRKPGKDIAVVSTTCKIGGSQEANGEVFATGLQPPVFEGKLGANVLIRLVENGGETSGPTYEAPASAAAEPTLEGPPAEFNSMPNPAFVGKLGADNQAAVDDTKLWGLSMEELCSA